MKRNKKTGPYDEILGPLPAELAAVVRGVVRRTKLWPGEKRDVCQELAGHFLDGLETLQRDPGLDAEAAAKRLAECFGDEKVAARLIRRSKKRCRPLIWKAWIRSCQSVGVCILLLVLVGGWRLTGKPHPTVNYVAQLNQQADAIPESDRAWPLYLQAIERFTGTWAYSFGQEETWPDLRPGDPEWGEVQKWLADCQPVIEILKDAARRPHYGAAYQVGFEEAILGYRYRQTKHRYPNLGPFDRWKQETVAENKTNNSNEVPMMMEVLLGHLPPMREMSKMMVLYARDCAAQGRIAEAVDHLLLVHRIGCQLLQDAIVITQMVGAENVRIAGDAMRSLLTKHGPELSRQDLQRLSHQWAANVPVGGIRIHLGFERLAFADTVQHAFTKNPWGDGHLVLRGERSALSLTDTWVVGNAGFSIREPVEMLFLHAGRKETLAKHEEVWGELTKRWSAPLYSPQRKCVDQKYNEMFDTWWSSRRYHFICTMFPSLARADEVLRQTAMSHEATLVVTALTARRNETGAYPQALSELVPTYLPGVPEDVYDGGPLKYRLDAGGQPVLYSIWENFVDDGGRACAKENRHRVEGDKVYFGSGA